ncbi:hypothetical protein SSX86_025967 [Deinandra increscens subsp. villosa]|uniref:Protein LURP-one-related 15 n=1 Tax=Deinandra increscens subsp. villosa TaxID=3103831 RepID=A0AAP0CHA4_9ASTR
MAQPSYELVIGSQFVAQSEFNVIVNKFSGGELVITNTENKIMFTVKACDTSFHSQRSLQDEGGKTIATLREKIMTAHERWNAFRGHSKADRDKIFSVVTNRMIQYGTHVKVFLANNMSDICDFYMRGSWSNRNCTIYKGDSSSTTIIAQYIDLLFQMQLWQSPERFMVTIYPNVDYAFVVTLIAILDVMKSLAKDDASEVVAEVLMGL